MNGEGNGTPLQYSCLENPMDGGAWWATVHRVTKSHTWLSDFTFIFHSHALEKEMATHSSVLALKIPGTGEPGGLLSMGLHRVGNDWSNLAACMKTSWWRKDLPQLEIQRKNHNVTGRRGGYTEWSHPGEAIQKQEDSHNCRDFLQEV